MDRLANKNILITGGNSGIGLTAAQEFDREGARVAICGMNERTLQATRQALGYAPSMLLGTRERVVAIAARCMRDAWCTER